MWRTSIAIEFASGAGTRLSASSGTVAMAFSASWR